ncbi:hypothetical protein C8A05DRAFT_34500 [Staphylotrichum tortipilum]|uniref:NAD(P)-binding domain-containing protein n=1 Tax=Staphylotrichum tortipilum TaxID=2831512 RepID=A0AAN6RT40_9PEZI|nr:hypothetical protein C8A05DRAFT_34500 [Staphylotrichum longicolle]
MPSYAVLGATGGIGRSLLRVLLQSPDNQINAYCRSRAKLLRVCPEAANTEQLKVFEGRLDDVSLIAGCIRDTRAVFLAVSVSDNMPGCTIAREATSVAVAALDDIRKRDGPTTRLPTVILSSSASLDHSFSGDVPPFVHWLLDRAVSNLYHDLAEAESLLRAQKDWVSTVFVRPGGLVHDRQGGHEISTTTAKTPLSFLDLAAGMVEIAEDKEGRHHMRSVSVLPTSDKVAFPWDCVYFVLTGLLYHYLPWTYRFFGEYRRR